MSEKEILITLHAEAEDIVRSRVEDRFRGSGYKVNAIYSESPLDEKRLCGAVREADGLIVGLEKVTGAVLDAGRNLRVVSKFGVGTDNIDIAAATRKGVAVANCPGSNSNAVA